MRAEICKGVWRMRRHIVHKGLQNQPKTPNANPEKPTLTRTGGERDIQISTQTHLLPIPQGFTEFRAVGQDA
jgi:hypothetical protein